MFRICWLIVILISVSICITLICTLYKKWISSPVIVSFATIETQLFEIPFPAVTICPEVKLNASIFNYTDAYLKMKTNRPLSANESKYFQYMSWVCSTPPALIDKDMLTVGEEAVNYLIKASPQFRDYVYDVEWEGSHFYESSSTLFTPILTGEGLCYSFNILDGKEMFSDVVKPRRGFYTTNGLHSRWSSEAGYSPDVDSDEYPRRTLAIGMKGGLKIKLRFLKHQIDHSCGNSLQGYKATLHQPSDLPRIKHSYFRVPFEHSVVVVIKPSIMVTSSDLKDYDVKHRKCYFESENSLKYFRSYSQQNCYVECLTNFTLNMCECVEFNFPHEEDTPVCGPSNIECVDYAKVAFLLNELPQNIRASKISKIHNEYYKDKVINEVDKCNCLPSCNSISFDAETSQTSLKWNQTVSTLHEDDRIFLTELNLFFKNNEFITMKKSALYGTTDFWASVAGITGLFTGFSFISMFEILY